MLTSGVFPVAHELEHLLDDWSSEAIEDPEAAKELHLLLQLFLFLLTDNPFEVLCRKNREITICLADDCRSTSLVIFEQGQLTEGLARA